MTLSPKFRSDLLILLVYDQKSPDDNYLINVWILYHGRRGENIVKSWISKIQRYLNTRKVSYFTSNKDKIPDLPKIS